MSLYTQGWAIFSSELQVKKDNGIQISLHSWEIIGF